MYQAILDEAHIEAGAAETVFESSDVEMVTAILVKRIIDPLVHLILEEKLPSVTEESSPMDALHYLQTVWVSLLLRLLLSSLSFLNIDLGRETAGSHRGALAYGRALLLTDGAYYYYYYYYYYY
jgi:hypothetical protein